MKSIFITLAFDRLKHKDIVSLYTRLCKYSANYTTNIDFLKAIERLKSFEQDTEVLHKKERKLPNTAQLTKLRAANDNMVIAIQHHLNALGAAQFDEQKVALSYLTKDLLKLFKGHKRKLIGEKKSIIENFYFSLNNTLFQTHCETLGLMCFIDKMKQTDERIQQLVDEQKQIKSQQPAPYAAIPTKVKLISELRLFLKTIDMYHQIQPELDEENLVQFVDRMLTEYRTQLRNTRTRRLNKNKKMNEQTTPIESS